MRVIACCVRNNDPPPVRTVRASAEAAQFVQSQRPQRAAMHAREIVADDQGQVERLCDRFDPADQIDAWPDDGEIEPVGRADIAVNHGAVVQRDHHLERLAAQRFMLDRAPPAKIRQPRPEVQFGRGSAQPSRAMTPPGWRRKLVRAPG